VKTTRSRRHEKREPGATLMKAKSFGAGVMFMKRRAPVPKLCHFSDSSATRK